MWLSQYSPKQSEAVSEAMSSEQENKRKKSSEEVFKQINGVEFYATNAILYSLYKQGDIAIALVKDKSGSIYFMFTTPCS